MRARVCAERSEFTEARSLITADTAARWLRDAIRYGNGNLILWIRDNYPSSVPTVQDLMLMACLEGRPNIFEALQLRKVLPIAHLGDIDVVRRQSPQWAQQIFLIMMPRMTVGERCALADKLCEEDEFQLVLLLDESYGITAADVGHKDARSMLNHACVNGNLELAVWLANWYELQAPE